MDDGICSESAPVIAPRGPDRRPWLVGTPYSVADAVAALERGETAAALGLSEHQERLVLEYAERSV